MAGVIILDASVLIAHFDQDDACHEQARTWLQATAEAPLAASALTVAEVLVGPTRRGRPEVAQAALRDLGVNEIPVPAGSAGRLAELRANTGLKLPDCCVLLAAEQVSAAAILTFDERLARRAHDFGYQWEPVVGDSRPDG